MPDRGLRVIMEVVDKFTAPLNNFEKGMQKSADASTKASRELEKTASTSDRLQSSFGGSSRAVNVFGNALGNAIGLTGEFGYTLDVLMDSGIGAAASFGTMTAATFVLGAAVNAIKTRYEELQKELDNTAAAYVRLAEAQNKSGHDRVASDAADSAKRQVEALDKAIEETSKALALASMRYRSMTQQPAQDEAGRYAIQLQADEMDRLQKKLDELTKSKKEFSGTPLITPEMIGGLREFTNDTDRFAEKLDMVRINASLAAEVIGGMSSSPRSFGSDRFEQLNPYAGDLSKRSADIDKEARENASKAQAASERAAGILAQFRDQALNIYESLTSGSEVSAKQMTGYFVGAFQNMIAAEADLNKNTHISMIQVRQALQGAFGNMSTEMVQKLLAVMDAGGEMAQNLISQMYAIAAAGGSATDMANALAAALNSIPKDIYTKIHLGYTSSGPGGNQKGDEWNFTLEGEAYGVRAAYMNQYGDYGRANDAWQRDHRQELTDKYGVTGAGQANTKTGEVYQYAYGTHEMVTTPRMMLVGERGPERVDITPGGGMRGGGDGATVQVVLQSLTPPNEYQIQQLAAQLKRYMARN